MRRAAAALTVLLACSLAAAALAAGPRPTARLGAPGLTSDISRGQTVRLRWSGSGTPPLRYRVEIRRNSLINSRWRPLTPETDGLHAHFRGRPGVTYLFRLRARDGDGRLSLYDYERTVVPYDDKSGRIGYSPSWKQARRRGAYGRALHIVRRTGATAGVDFDGTQAVLVARTGPRAGKVAVSIDGRLAVRSLRSRRTRNRREIFRSRQLPPGAHRLRVRSLGGGAVNLDAVGIVQGPKAPAAP